MDIELTNSFVKAIITSQFEQTIMSDDMVPISLFVSKLAAVSHAVADAFRNAPAQEVRSDC